MDIYDSWTDVDIEDLRSEIKHGRADFCFRAFGVNPSSSHLRATRGIEGSAQFLCRSGSIGDAGTSNERPR